MMNSQIKTLILILTVSFFGCKSKTKTYQPTVTTIDGQISSANTPVIILKGDEEIKGDIDPNGKFKLQTELSKSGIYRLNVGYFYFNLFIVPGDKISIVADARNPSSAIFSGSHVNENKFLAEFEATKTNTISEDFQVYYGKEESLFIKQIEERTQKLISHQQEYQKKNGVFDESFAELISDEISYDAAIMKMNLPTYRKYIFPDSNIILSDTYDSFLQNIETENEENLMVPSYHEFLPIYLDFTTQLDTTELDSPLAVRNFNNIGKKFKSQKLKDILYYNLLKETLQTSINDAHLIIFDYNKLESNKQYIEEINNIYNSWKHLVAGQIAPNWKYPTNKGKDVQLSELKGKVVYIDIWATWCGPCMKELPFLEKLQDQFKENKDIAFVSISIDEHKEAWVAMLKQKNMKGIQLIADEAWNSKIIQDYRVSGIPRFIIVAKDGSLVNANAPRPSSSEISLVLSNALNQ